MVQGRHAHWSASLRPVLWWLEAAPVFVFWVGALLLPSAAASAFGGFVGRTLGPLLPYSGRATRNLRRIYPDMTVRDRRKTIRGMWDNLGRVAAESARIQALWDPRLSAAISELGSDKLLEAVRTGETVKIECGRIRIIGVENFVRLLSIRGPALIFVPHMGNWELLPIGAARFGVFTSAIFRRPNNPLLARLLDRSRAGMVALLPKGYEGGVAAGRVMQEGGRLGLLVDQKQNRGVALDFLGQPAMTGLTLARFALRFDAPIFGACCRRRGGRNFTIEITPPLSVNRTGDDAHDEKAIMQMVNNKIADWVRETPDQWLWLHRRWGK
ncbi:MAG: hypothetical protein OXC93_07135 [Rhodospirillaceae bacterium]|nr:hypothetical protein [Rhodospirillaceae bacterium]